VYCGVQTGARILNTGENHKFLDLDKFGKVTMLDAQPAYPAMVTSKGMDSDVLHAY